MDREYTNISDVNACLVWLPDKANGSLMENETDSKRGLFLKDILGLPCGHVPRGLAPSFRAILDAGGEIFAEAIGEPQPSFPPWPPVQSPGGGVVIPCNYTIKTKDVNAVRLIQNQLQEMPEKHVINVHLI